MQNTSAQFLVWGIVLNQISRFFKAIKKYIKIAWENTFIAFKARSISTQLIITIILIFASFFLLQSFLNSTFFKTYYTDKEFDDIHEDLMIYVENMNKPNADLFDEMDSFSNNQFAYTVIVDLNDRPLESSYSNYTINIIDQDSLIEYQVIVPDNQLVFATDEVISLILVPSNNELYNTVSITRSGETTIYNENACEQNVCTTMTAKVASIMKPNNLNYRSAELPIVQKEINKIQNDLIKNEDPSYTEGTWYKSTDSATDTLVFIHSLGQWQAIVTIVPIANTTEITSIITQYTYYVYLTAIVIITLWSFRLSTIISKPIKNIELVTKEIASLNFNVEAKEFNNKETSSLSESINLIAINMRNTLDTLNTKNTELTTLYDDQTKQVTLKKQLVSSISHELKTPLMIMQVIVQGIIDGIIDIDDQEKELGNVIEEIQKSSIMIQDMLQIYRLDDANSQLDITQFNFSEMIQFFIDDFDNVFKSNNLELSVDIPESIMLEADHKLIKRVLSNFITNAIKYTPDKQKICLKTFEKDNVIYFELINKGVQIDEEDLKNIWMPFFRIEHTEKRQLSSKGSGIGLYLVSEILKAHGADFGILNVQDGVKAYFSIKKHV